MQDISKFLDEGGFFMYVNLLCSAITIAVIVERTIFFLGKGSVNAKAFLEQIRKLVEAKNVDRARKLCQATEAPVARVARAGLEKLEQGEAAITTSIEETLVDVTPDLKKRVAALWSLANIATLIGLLGTISGLIGGFAAVAKAPAAERANLLAGRIAEAMNNTAMGLGIAATCMIAHVFLNAASKKQQHELESFAMKLENLLVRLAAGRA